jgi:hypothetical protein
MKNKHRFVDSHIQGPTYYWNDTSGYSYSEYHCLDCGLIRRKFFTVNNKLKQHQYTNVSMLNHNIMACILDFKQQTLHDV